MLCVFFYFFSFGGWVGWAFYEGFCNLKFRIIAPVFFCFWHPCFFFFASLTCVSPRPGKLKKREDAALLGTEKVGDVIVTGLVTS